MRGTGVILNLALILLAACTVVTTSAPPVTPLPTPVPSPTPLTTGDEAAFARQRERMVLETIERRGITDEDVLHAMRAVPRHLFVPENEQDYAYGDHPLPIGYGQTISQPYIVALMTELLELQEGDKVLEIGTGSGYQAAVLAEIPKVHCKQGDGYYGWPEHGPFDVIIVTAAPDHVPQLLVDQLANGGRMVVPIGPPGGYQTLWKFMKEPDGELRAFNMGGVAFVPLTGSGAEEHRREGGYEWPLP